MDLEFSEEELNKLIQEALSSSPNPLSPSVYLGLGESQLLENLYLYLKDYLPESTISSIYQDLRTDILSQKNNLSIKDFHTITINCRKCSLSGTSPELPKWNVKDPSVLFIAENPSLDEQSVNIFLTALKEANFKSSDVCLTYLNRCPVKRKYTTQEVFNCSPFLHTEIQLFNPKLIVTLGSLPLSSLLGTNVKLKDYRGNIIWLGNWAILPSYSPLFILKNGENYIDQFTSDIKSAYNFVTKEKINHESNNQ